MMVSLEKAILMTRIEVPKKNLKTMYFTIATCALALGMASVHISLLAPDISRYMPQDYGN